MESMTIDLSGVGEFGPHVYLFAYIVASIVFGTASRRHFRLAGEAEDSGVSRGVTTSSANITNGVVTGTLGLATFVTALVVSSQLCCRAMDKAYPIAAITDAPVPANPADASRQQALKSRDREVAWRKEAETELHRVKLNLIEANQELEAAKADKEQLIAGLEAGLTSEEIEEVLRMAEGLFAYSPTVTGEEHGTRDN